MVRILRKPGLVLLVMLALSWTATAQITIRGLGDRGRKDTERVKNITGIVQDSRGNPIVGARVTIRNTKDNTNRITTTDAKGNYSILGLPPDADYEVRADYQGKISERVLVSALLNREDNLVNFKLDVTVTGSSSAASDPGPELQTFDLVRLRASFEMPRAVPAPIRAVLLLHGYGEDRRVWQAFKTQLLAAGWAVMSLDLRGHGDSNTRNQRPLAAAPEWRSSPDAFPHDIDPALDWLKTQTRLDSHRIVIIGYDVGANMALFASGKFKEVRTVVAVEPRLNESLSMAGSAQDFTPRSAFVITSNEAEGKQIQPQVQAPFRLLTMASPGGTTAWFANRQVTDAIFQWLKETY